ncbi:MAG: M15 family metallopeptidase [Patescibacteria group bacterium]
MKKVLVTGTYDIIHPAHLKALKQARRCGDFLVAVVARDSTVERVKGYRPFFTETERVENLKKLRIANRVLLGNRGDKLKVVEALKPDVLCLGYDQIAFTEDLKKKLALRGLYPQIIRLRQFNQERYRTSKLHENGLVALKNIDPTIITEPRYATRRNFLKKPLYQNSIILTREHIAKKLSRVQKKLRARGCRLKVWDAYRPLSVQKQMWQAVPDERYIGNPATGPFHTRAAAIDCTVVDEQGRQLPMPTSFDKFSRRAHRNFPGHTPEERKNMRLLERLMAAEGFVPLESEWWHFSDPDWKSYPVLDISI